MCLAIELKRPQGSATKDQKKWKQDLEARGYQAVIAKGREACLEIIPDRGGLGILKNLLEKDEVMSPQDKEQLQIMMAQRSELENEITQRWQADSSSSSWLASNVRPLIVLILVITLLVFIVLDSMDLSFFIRDAWISLYEVLTLTVVGGYFTLRSVVDKRTPKP